MFLLTLNLIICVSLVVCLENGLARTPPMGWMHWERYRCITDCVKYPDECIHENLFKKVADLLVQEGYADAGYEYVIIDDCWLEKERDTVTQKLVPDRQRFPNGLNYLSDYIHNKGLKFGLYESYGTKTCAGYPGVINNMELDAQTFADWKVDYVKLDGCNSKITDMDIGYPEFGRLLNQTGRPMVYSCSWPYFYNIGRNAINYEILKEHCNLWRIWHDIQDSYQSFISIANYFAKIQLIIQPHAGPGHWNDPDMLILGNFGITYEQSKVQMAIWSVLAAPLIMSNDLAAVPKEIKEILVNKDVIAVNQDILGIQGIRISYVNQIQIWIRPITPVVNNFHSYAIAFVNKRTDGHGTDINATLNDFLPKNQKYFVTDLYNKNFISMEINSTDTFVTRINPTGVRFFKFTVL